MPAWIASNACRCPQQAPERRLGEVGPFDESEAIDQVRRLVEAVEVGHNLAERLQERRVVLHLLFVRHPAGVQEDLLERQVPGDDGLLFRLQELEKVLGRDAVGDAPPPEEQPLQYGPRLSKVGRLGRGSDLLARQEPLVQRVEEGARHFLADGQGPQARELRHGLRVGALLSPELDQDLPVLVDQDAVLRDPVDRVDVDPLLLVEVDRVAGRERLGSLPRFPAPFPRHAVPDRLGVLLMGNVGQAEEEEESPRIADLREDLLGQRRVVSMLDARRPLENAPDAAKKDLLLVAKPPPTFHWTKK